MPATPQHDEVDNLPAHATWRPLTLSDVGAVHALVERSAEVDDPQEHFTEDDLHDELSASWLDLGRDSRGLWDTEGTLRAFGMVDLRPGDVELLRPSCFGTVDPQWRRRGVGRELLSWQLERAQELVSARRADLGGTPPARASVMEEQGNPSVGALAESLAMRVERWFWVMRRALDGPLPEAAPPEGITLERYDASRDADRLRLAHNAAFADHWGFQPWGEDAWRQWEVDYRNFRPEWGVVAIADDGEVAGYALGHAYEQDWVATGVKEGWTSKLGVLPAWRGRGVARALLAAQLRTFANSGMAMAGLDVDADNPNGAVGLYRGLGYGRAHQNKLWVRWL